MKGRRFNTYYPDKAVVKWFRYEAISPAPISPAPDLTGLRYGMASVIARFMYNPLYNYDENTEAISR